MKRLAIMLVLVCAAPIVRAGSPEEDWKAVVALDAGPPGEPKTQDEARERALGHLEKQERALRAFLVGHAEDERAFEARLRLSRALQIRADFTGDEKLRADAMKLLVELDRTATPAQRVEVDFAKITALMRTLRQPTREQREELLAEARKFQGDHPGDRRLASLLAEVAALFDMQPATKLALLEDALPLAKDAELKSRIADDLKRVTSSVAHSRSRGRPSRAARPAWNSSGESLCSSCSSPTSRRPPPPRWRRSSGPWLISGQAACRCSA